MIIVSATAWWAMPTLQIQAVDFLAFVGWALPTIPYRLAARGSNDDQGPKVTHQTCGCVCSKHTTCGRLSSMVRSARPTNAF